MYFDNINNVEGGNIQEILGINEKLYIIVENNTVFTITIIIGIISILYSIIKKKYILINTIISILFFVLGIVCSTLLSNMKMSQFNYLLRLIIPITLQLIPFIICLKNNKKVKKDEVKQNV